jgi:Domain of unknown function (DUF4190)
MTAEPPEGSEPGIPVPVPPSPPPPPTYPPPTYPPPAFVGPDQARTSTNGFAVAALVLGIVGPVACIAWILALVFGYVARSQIDASGGRQQGRGMAVAGIVLGWVWGGLIILYFAVVIISTANSGS